MGAMTRPELRIFLGEWYCGCGDPEAASKELLDLLRQHPLYEGERGAKLRKRLGDGIFYITLYTLDHFDLTEHGGGVNGAWLTLKGEDIRDALAREEADDFEALHKAHCAHGFDIDDETHNCFAKTPEPEQEGQT